MNWLDVANKVAVVAGIPSIFVALIYIGKKLQVLNTLEATTVTVKHNIKVIGDFLTKKSSLHFDPSELKNYSPLALTPVGQELVKSLGFKAVFSQHKEDFFKCIDEEKPKLKYDVELAAIKSIYMLADRDYMSFLKVFFYNTPSRNMENIAPTLGVYVRDVYLEEHPEIKE